MQTDTVAACYIENNDHIVIDGEVKGYVYTIEDGEGDTLILDLVDDDGDHHPHKVAPFDPVTFVTSFAEEVDEDDEEE